MQHEMQTSIEKITSFFKNKFDIFKNKLLPKSSSDSTIISIVDSANISTPQSCKKITTSKHNNNNLIYTSSVNIKHSNNNNNKVDSTNINMQPDTITVTTTTTTTVTTIHNTHTHTHTNLLPYHINYECKHIVDYSKYTD